MRSVTTKSERLHSQTDTAVPPCFTPAQCSTVQEQHKCAQRVCIDVGIRTSRCRNRCEKALQFSFGIYVGMYDDGPHLRVQLGIGDVANRRRVTAKRKNAART